MGKLEGARRVLKNKLKKPDYEDFCNKMHENDVNFIKCCLADYVPELLLMEDNEVQTWCIEHNIHDQNDLFNIVASGVGITEDNTTN